VLRAAGSSPFFLTCEHAGRRLPARLGDLGLDAGALGRHIAWDIGAAGVARRLSAQLDATCVLQTYSRLVVDCNRWPGAEDFICTLSEDTVIPGNRSIPEEEAAARAAEIFHPYHDRIHALLEERGSLRRDTVLVAIHSCTPVYLGKHRPWHIGILYEKDPRLAHILLRLLGSESELIVGDNEPYFMSSDKDYAVPVHGESRGLVHVELEIRQDLITEETGQAAWAHRLAGLLSRALAELRPA
jgi:predicted N-formylglutamate amidohydrolase